MTHRASTLSLGATALVVLGAHFTLFPKVADLDGFYHLGHAAAYAEGSILDTSLPWATQSVIGDRGADIWWGFHVVLVPFTAIADIEWGLRIAAVVLTMVLTGCFFLILRRHGVPAPGWWTTVFLLAVPNVLYRHLMLRPHVLSSGVSLLLLSVLARGRWQYALLLSATMTWLHLSLFWMAPGIAVAYASVRAAEEALGLPPNRAGVAPLAAIGAVLLGTTAGWLLRPHAIRAASLAGVQIIRLLAQKATEEPLLFSAELFPLSLTDFARSSGLFLPVWLAVAGVLAVYAVKRKPTGLRPEERTLLVTAQVVSATFLLLALFSARRAMVEWVAFGVLALALLSGAFAPLLRRRGIQVLAAVLLTAHLGWSAWRHKLNVDLVAFPPDTMADVASFLEDHSDPGEIVFHARWDNFGPLFARNRTNLYLGGMDPIFQFVHDPRRYWEFFYLSADLTVDWTCDAFPCASGAATDTHRVLRERFNARWVVVEPSRNPRLSLYLLNDPRYALAHETQREAVFEVLANARTPGG